MGFKISLIAPESQTRTNRDGHWDVAFWDSTSHANIQSLVPDELDELELALACRRAQLGLPRLTGVVPVVSGHRFDDAGDAVSFTGSLRQYDGGGLAVIVTRDGERFPFDERVEVIYP
jgi:hypothetical protein